jgi:small subunit ribosomal protein S8
MDPINDMLNRIRNAQAVLKSTVEVPYSNLKQDIAKILQKEGFIKKVEKKGKKSRKILEIVLKYENSTEGGLPVPAISGLRRISKSGQRIYTPSKKIRKVRNGYGISIISTSKGLMTNKEARKKKLGGEVICEVW